MPNDILQYAIDIRNPIDLQTIRKALENAKPPKPFEGLPITLVAAALTSLTFMSFTGMAEKLFGG